MAKKVQEAGIHKDTREIWDVIYKGQFEMCKRDRPVMAVRLLNKAEDILEYFCMSYKVSDPKDKKDYTERMLGAFDVLKSLIREAKDENMFKLDSTKNRLTELVVRMDEGMEKYHRKLVLNDYRLS
ncbi:MAG: hypothetical protein ACI30I_04690 [Parabacteroides sp.]